MHRGRGEGFPVNLPPVGGGATTFKIRNSTGLSGHGLW